ncbi:hypothetical protein NST48_09390 [Paenibacillus sp. FSL M7-0547]|uniref:hypothetical protein n=1 Tax=Paenibacillus sp. FSL M7-0547 TaxID=2954755 RepID=UPI0030FBA854
MKKFISGVIVGALMFAGASVFADSSSLIGKKVQGLFSIEQSGSKIADAVIIDGSAYAPIRAVAEATGSTLKVEGKKIVMGDTPTTSSTSVKTLATLQAERVKVVSEIEQKSTNIERLKTEEIPRYETFAKEMESNKTMSAKMKAVADEYRQTITQTEIEVVNLQKQLADIDAQIATLGK